jgi:hypothetical protein
MAHFRSNLHANPSTHVKTSYGLQPEKVVDIKTGNYHHGKEEDVIRTSFVPTVHHRKSYLSPTFAHTRPLSAITTH